MRGGRGRRDFSVFRSMCGQDYKQAQRGQCYRSVPPEPTAHIRRSRGQIAIGTLFENKQLDRHIAARERRRFAEACGSMPSPGPSFLPPNICFELHSQECNCVPLAKVLEHSSLAMTRRYANVMTEGLQAAHEKLSLLGGGKIHEETDFRVLASMLG